MNPPGEPWQPAHQWATTGDLSEIFPGGGSATYVRDDAFGNPVYVDDDGNEIRAARPGSGKYQAAGAPYEEIGDTNWIRPSPSPSPSGGSGVGDLLPEPDMFRRSREGLTPLQSYLQYEKGKEYLQRQRRRGIQGILNAISNAAYHSSKMAGNEGSSYTGPTLRRGPFGVKSGYIGGSY